jgi:hypothetical protein
LEFSDDRLSRQHGHADPENRAARHPREIP